MRSLRNRVRRTCLVTMKSGAWVRGVLWEADRTALVVRNAETEGDRSTPTAVDGEVLILLADVDFIQFP